MEGSGWTGLYGISDLKYLYLFTKRLAIVEANEGLKILDTAYTTEDYAAAVSKDNPALTAALNKALQELKDDGTIQGILDKYIKAE